jgi:hypothetical protein
MLARDEIDEEEYRHRRALADQPTGRPAHPRGAPGGLKGREVTT